jgi:hypothetical protein
MDIKSLIRDPTHIHACLQELPDGRLVATSPVKIYVPSRFVERGLAEIGIDTYIVGIYAIVSEDKYYAISLVNAMIRIEPMNTLRVKIRGEEYLEFSFIAGSTVMSSVNLVKTDTLVYRIYDEILSKGRVPWYLGYDDLGHIFDTAFSHAGAKIGENVEVTELLISLISRDSKDRTRYYRSTFSTFEEMAAKVPAFIPLRSVTYSATNTTNKLAGSYFNTGVVSALVDPADRVERIEEILRK